jgi:hypothetical protein
MPDPQPQGTHQPTRLLSRPRPATSSMADFVGSTACPWRLLRHATVSTVPRVQGQGRPPGQATGGQSHGPRPASASPATSPTTPRSATPRAGSLGPCSESQSAAVGSRRRRSSPWSSGATRPSMQPSPLAKGSRMVVVGRLQQRAWTAEDGSARSTVEVVADGAGAEPALGDGHDHQGDEEPGPVASSTRRCDGAGCGQHARVPLRRVRTRES